jgi:aminomuconate-semialdehyde/2-hydroxymuconate-6-semialdehyde dehydrogenase
VKLSNWINGQAAAPAEGAYLDNVDPKTGEVCGLIPRSSAADVASAVAAAKAAQRLTALERSELLIAVADAVAKRIPEFAEAEAMDSGKTLTATTNGDIPRALDNLRFYAAAIRNDSTSCHQMEDGLNYTLRQPLGNVALITPWNFPFHLFTWKVAPALAMGNAVVVKPSEMTPTTATMCAEVFSEVGAPAGLLNIVHGLGHEAGEALVLHPDIKAVSFTGGTVTGKHIAGAAAPLLKKVSLELGGKNPSLVFADSDLSAAVAGVARAAFFNTGQVCLCGSRLLVERSVHDEFVERLAAEVAAGDWTPGESMGALISYEHREKVASYVQLAKEEGGTIVCGGNKVGPEKGAFFEPTIITGLPIDCRVATEEIFGPIVTVHPFDTEEQALEMANFVQYGLGSSIWTQNITRAHRLAASIESGMVWINTWNKRDFRVPFGGMKQSGVGREGGRYSMEFFSQDRNVCLQL